MIFKFRGNLYRVLLMHEQSYVRVVRPCIVKYQSMARQKIDQNAIFIQYGQNTRYVYTAGVLVACRKHPYDQSRVKKLNVALETEGSHLHTSISSCKQLTLLQHSGPIWAYGKAPCSRYLTRGRRVRVDVRQASVKIKMDFIGEVIKGQKADLMGHFQRALFH